jgi:hypothetical protein
MRSISRVLRFALAAGIGLAMSVTFSPLAGSASEPATVQTEAHSSAATWDLSDGEQRLCIPAERNYRSYFVGAIAGSWDTPLSVEVQGFPEEVTVEAPTTVQPGDNGDKYIGVIWIFVEIAPLDYGEYTATLTVSDGADTQTAPLVIKAQEKWGCSNA